MDLFGIEKEQLSFPFLRSMFVFIVLQFLERALFDPDKIDRPSL